MPEIQARAEAGRRLVEAIRDLSRHTDLGSLHAFASRRDTPNHDTFMNWQSGASTPSPRIVEQAARVLVDHGAQTSFADLMAVYEGRDMPDPTLIDLLHQQMARIDEQAQMIEELGRAVWRLLDAIGDDTAEDARHSLETGLEERQVPDRARMA